MPYAAEGKISQTPLHQGIEITELEYKEALAAMLEGKFVSIASGSLKLEEPDQIKEEEIVEEPETPDQLLLRVADLRWSYETGGMLHGNMAIETDDRAKLMLTASYTRAAADPAYEVIWKTTQGFVRLSSFGIIALADALHTFVEACFTREQELVQHIEAGTFEEAMLSQGWPNNSLLEVV